MLEFLFYPFFILVLLAFTRKLPALHLFGRNEYKIDMGKFARVNAILQNNIPYYQKLSTAGRQRFFYRLDRFISDKEFKGMEGLQVTAEMMAVIAAPAIQLTFGLDHFTLDTIESIEVYPDTFYSRFHSSKLKGITTGSGVLAVSWKDVQEGYRVPDDKYNLGLHEMAHALKLTVVRQYDYDMNFASYLENWLAIGLKEYLLMKNEESSFMRSYGGTNSQEFFAVSVEHFFEVPAAFKAALPDIYNHLCILLNQDPLNDKQDYRLKQGFAREINLDKKLFPVPEKIIPNYGYSNWHWTLTLMFIGVVSLFLLPIVSAGTIMENGDMWRIMAGIYITGAIVFYKPLVKGKVMKLSQFIWYLLIVIVPLGFCLFFLINRSIIVSSSRVETRMLQHKTLPNGMVVPDEEGRDGPFETSIENPPVANGKSVVAYYKYKGIFGYSLDKNVIEKAPGN